MSKPRKPSPPARKTAAKRPSGEIRLIGGHWKRTKLKVADKPGLRPTPDRVRETVFNWLGQDLSGLRCMDAFAGTGALGLEAASRGAAQVLLVEQDAAAVAQLQRALTQLQALKLPEPVVQRLAVQRGDGLAALRQQPAASCDVIFLDPPFDAGLYDEAIAAAARALAPGGTIYLESPTAWTDEALAGHGLAVHRHLKAGAVHAHILRRATQGAGEAGA